MLFTETTLTKYPAAPSLLPSLASAPPASAIPAYCGSIALRIWNIRGCYDAIPVEIEESPKVDGATPFQAFRECAADHYSADTDDGVRAHLYRAASLCIR